MKNTVVRSASLAVLSSVLFAGTLAAQAVQPPVRSGAGQGAAGMPRYELTTVTTVEGTLIAVDTVKSMAGIQGTGLHATLRANDKGVLPIHLGPTIYLTKQKVKLLIGDKVKITGSKVSISTVPTILAASVVKGTDTLALRDANGLPLWRGIRRP